MPLSLLQTLFALLNATDLSQLIIRLLEDGGTADNTIYVDLV